MRIRLLLGAPFERVMKIKLFDSIIDVLAEPMYQYDVVAYKQQDGKIKVIKNRDGITGIEMTKEEFFIYAL